MEFEWDPPKAVANVRKHGVTFDEAATVFLDELAVSGADPDHFCGRGSVHHFWHIEFGSVAGGITHVPLRCHTHHQCAKAHSL